MYLIFDTETSGLPDRKLPLTHAAQPRLVQLGAILADAEFAPRAELSLLVDPEGATFDPGSVAVHGITEETATRFGIPLAAALDLFDRLAARAEVLVAHNIEFDLGVLAVQYARLSRSNPLAQKAREDTMLLAQPVLALPSRRGDGFKPPSLAEAYRHFFQAELEGAHSALPDALACLKVFRALKAKPREMQGSLFD